MSSVCVPVTHVHAGVCLSMHVEVRGQLERINIPPLPPYGSKAWNSHPRAWHQPPLPSEPHRPLECLLHHFFLLACLTDLLKFRFVLAASLSLFLFPLSRSHFLCVLPLSNFLLLILRSFYFLNFIYVHKVS